MVEGRFDVLAQVVVHFGTLASSHELFLRVVSQVAHCISHHHLVSLSEVLLLEGFSQNLNNLVDSSLGVAGEQSLGLLTNHFAHKFELQLCLLDVVSDGEETDPVLGESVVHGCVALNESLLVLEYFADTGDGIVPSVVELCRLRLLLVDLSSHLVLYSHIKSFEAVLTVVCEGCSTVLCDNTDSVGGGLTKTGTLVSRELADSLHDGGVIFGGEVGGSKVLDEVVEDEETELHTLLDAAAEGLVEGGGPEGLHDVRYHALVSFKKTAHELCGGQLQVVLVVTFLFDQIEVFLVELIVLVFDFFSFDFVKFLDALQGLVDDAESHLTDFLNLMVGKEVLAHLDDDFFNSGDLGNEAVSFGFLLHCLEDAGVVVASHIVQVLVDSVLSLEALEEAGECRHTGLSDAVVGGEGDQTDENF